MKRTSRARTIAERLYAFQQAAKDYAASSSNISLSWLVQRAAEYLDEIERMERHERAEARKSK